LETVQDRRS